MTSAARSVTVTPAASLEADCLRLLLQAAGVPVVADADEHTTAVVLALPRSIDLAAPASAIRMPPTGRVPLLLVADAVDSKALALARGLRASGVVSWCSPTDVLVSAVRTVSEGGRVPRRSGRNVNPDPLTQLTSRERDVAALLALGEQDDGIGDRLGITPATVHSHMQHVLVKLDAPHRHAAAVMARQSPLLSQRLREWRTRDQVTAG
ncbi:MAG TPA: LuxR C-terminal-related transcriptional regulator [Nocardioidaceae bacterium]|nr:LuxR C-terminal-related transcriptional regulator [Nocardioidaceae bacterium]